MFNLFASTQENWEQNFILLLNLLMSGTPSAKLRVEAGWLNRILSVTINTLFLDIEHSNYKRLLALKVLSSRTILVELLFCFFFSWWNTIFVLYLAWSVLYIYSKCIFLFQTCKIPQKPRDNISQFSATHTEISDWTKILFFLFFFLNLYCLFCLRNSNEVKYMYILISLKREAKIIFLSK